MRAGARHTVLAALLCLSAAMSGGRPAVAADYAAWNTMRVRADPERAGRFVVLRRALAGPADYWCAAGDYAVRRLDVPVTGRVYVVGRVTGGVLFTVVASDDVAGGRRPGEGGKFGLSLTETGFNLRAAHARLYCPDSLRRLAGFRF